ncbi:MAG: hypothetical protein U0X20_22240 [Caldilineaceae bacterium]
MARANARITEVSTAAIRFSPLSAMTWASTCWPKRRALRAQRAEEEDEPLQVDEFSLEY